MKPMKLINCKCNTYAITGKSDWDALVNGDHHPSCEKSWIFQKREIEDLCKYELDRCLSSAPDLAEKILEILNGPEDD